MTGVTSSANRDRAQFFVGGGGLGRRGHPTTRCLTSSPQGTPIRSGVTAGIYATMRVRDIAYAGVGSPNITEATSLYIDGEPSIGGATVSTAA